ncbi:chymotrypsin-elastase inhibitor ixodidin [Ixodes scapularis]|uniref:chymotrypsin-elastase inhibitor ixodidin n=1 Tax=Ixodes scapularis TaxID=6945 RepID=UPI001C3853A9|nr:chymotrypsin-elastase inhibitor ixodidin [Ixodes scapularis]
MWKIVVVALLSYLALASARPEQYDGGLYIPTSHPHRCGENEIFKSCTSSSCAEATCERPRVGPACTADCVSGCFCQRGYYRDEAKNCVTKQECPEDSPAHTYVENDYALE